MPFVNKFSTATAVRPPYDVHISLVVRRPQFLLGKHWVGQKITSVEIIIDFRTDGRPKWKFNGLLKALDRSAPQLSGVEYLAIATVFCHCALATIFSSFIGLPNRLYQRINQLIAQQLRTEHGVADV